MITKIYLGCITALAFLLVINYIPYFSLYGLLLFYLVAVVNTGILDFFGRFTESYIHHTRKVYQLKHEVYLYILFAVSIICIQPVAWKHIVWLAANVDPATFLYFLFLPGVWLLRFQFTETAKVSLVCLGIIPVLLFNKYNSIAETFAILTFLLWGAMTLEVLFQKNQ